MTTQLSLLFLDEIGDMSPAFQAKLLRAIEDGKLRRLGANHEIPVNVRVISATNQDLPRMIREKRFRLDLYHRLNTIEITVPPLRNRPEDLEPLFRHFLEFYARELGKNLGAVDSRILKRLAAYDFPGNVRELRNLVERAVILEPGDRLEAATFPFPAFESDAAAPPAAADRARTDWCLADAEKRLIVEALAACHGDRQQAARRLEISPYALQRKLKKFGISRPPRPRAS